MSSFIRRPLNAGIAERWRLLMYPPLRNLAAVERNAALRDARETELDMFERIGILGSIAGTTVLLQDVGVDWSSQLARYLVQFALALPLLGCAVGAFLVRRTRRGLDAQLRTRSEQSISASDPDRARARRHIVDRSAP